MTHSLDKPSKSMGWNRYDLIAAGLLAVGVAWGIHRFWQPGIAGDADMLMAIYRIFDLADAWQQGVFYPRLSPNLNFGYGAPLFQYYPPLASYVAVLFVGLGIGYVEAAKVVFTLALASAALGAYSYARWLFDNRLAAWLSGVAFIFSPYVLLNIFERGALSEVVGMALLPWLFLALHRLIYAPDTVRFIIAAMIVAMSVLAHNVTALFVMPALFLFVMAVALLEGQPKKVALPVLALFVGFGLSAFYWLPAIGELSYSRAESFMLGDSDASTVAKNLVTPSNLLQWSLVAEYAGPARFRFGVVQVIFAMLGLVAIRFQSDLARRAKIALWLMAAIVAVVLLLQLTWLRPFWDGLPLIRFIQFSWRLLGLASFATAILIGSLACLPRPVRRVSSILAAGISLLLMFTATYRLSPDLLPGWYQIESSQISKATMFERGRQGYALFTDYTPVSLNIPAEALSWPRQATEAALPPVLPPRLTLREASPNYLELISESSVDYPLRVHRTYFPGWQLLIDGQPAETFASGASGVVTAEVPEGQHKVVITFGDTQLRWTAIAVSGIIAISIVIFCIWLAFVRRRPAVLIAVIVAFAILASAFAISRSHRDNGIQVNRNLFGEQLSLLGHRLSDPANLQPGGTLSLNLFWWASQTPPADYTVFLHLVRADDESNKIAQIDKQPMLGYSPMTRWESGEIVDDLYMLEIPADASPGEYVLLVGAYDPNTLTNLPISGDGEILPGDRLVVTRLQVK